MTSNRPPVAIGAAYRAGVGDWFLDNMDRFDLLEITVDHCHSGDRAAREAIFELVGRVPLTAHGIGLSIGTDEPLDLAYLDRVAATIDRLKAPAYSEHLAFTRIPGRELANLLPLPRTETTAEMIIGKVRQIQSRLSVPFLLENIAYVFDWPDSVLSDAEFFSLICGETGAGMLLDVENLRLNAHNHGFDAYAFLDALPAGVVKEVHIAGGVVIREGFLERPFLADSHSRPVAGGAFDLLDHTLSHHAPAAIVLERDERLESMEEILDDIARIHRCVAPPTLESARADPAVRSAS